MQVKLFSWVESNDGVSNIHTEISNDDVVLFRFSQDFCKILNKQQRQHLLEIINNKIDQIENESN
jgi:hypothetical protein